MKKFFSAIISILLAIIILTGCDQTAPAQDSLTIDDSYQIVYASNCDENVRQAALCLQVTLQQQADLDLSITSAADSKAILLQINSKDLEEGQYRMRLTGSGLTVEAHSSYALLLGVRQIRNDWFVDGNGSLTLTADLCKLYSGSVDMEQAPYTVLSQNLRAADDSNGNSIENRSKRFQQLLWEYQPDIICTQETNQIGRAHV